MASRSRGALIQIGAMKIDRDRWDAAEIDRNPFFAPDAGIVDGWADLLDRTRKAGSSLGAIVEVTASGVPAGLGEPIYSKLDADLAAAMMGINAVKGVEIGDGFAAALLTGDQNADEMRMRDGKVTFTSNHAGGVQGGISTGQDVVVRFAVKPTSSILTPRKTVDLAGNERDIATKGRHDPCVGIRAVASRRGDDGDRAGGSSAAPAHARPLGQSMAVYTEVGDDELRAFMAAYDLGNLLSCKGIAEGVENSNFLIVTDYSPFILTLYEKRVNEAELPYFLGLMEHIADKGFTCPTPVRTREGEALRRLAGRPAAIVTFLTGMWPQRITEAHCAALGKALADFHAAGADFAMTRRNSLSIDGWRPLFR